MDGHAPRTTSRSDGERRGGSVISRNPEAGVESGPLTPFWNDENDNLRTGRGLGFAIALALALDALLILVVRALFY